MGGWVDWGYNMFGIIAVIHIFFKLQSLDRRKKKSSLFLSGGVFI